MKISSAGFFPKDTRSGPIMLKVKSDKELPIGSFSALYFENKNFYFVVISHEENILTLEQAGYWDKNFTHTYQNTKYQALVNQELSLVEDPDIIKKLQEESRWA